MCVHICIFACVCDVHTLTHAHTHTHQRSWKQAIRPSSALLVFTCVCVCARVCIYMRVCIHMWTPALFKEGHTAICCRAHDLCVCVCDIYNHTQIHAHTHTHTHTSALQTKQYAHPQLCARPAHSALPAARNSADVALCACSQSRPPIFM